MSHASTAHKSSGCGCGGSSSGIVRAGNAVGTASRGGCGCGCSDRCGGCEGQDFARPRFFAGQLLTEDDLDLLATYVVEKNRLHNRNFFGEGVVCGLAVTCDPCGGGHVTVQPGHALDCCGNDIVVPCPQTLDINAMVRRLRIEKNGGVDCGDPCADGKARVKPGRDAYDRPRGEEKPPPLPRAEYCLYTRYCEDLEDPVSPYATDDPCGAQACEATRIREGFTFELRCRARDGRIPDNLFSRVAACFGNLVTAERTARDSRTALLYGTSLRAALGRLEQRDAPATFDQARLDQVAQAEARAKRLPDNLEEWTAADAFEAADASQTMAALVAGWRAMTVEERRQVPNAQAVEKVAQQAAAGLTRVVRLSPQSRMTQLLDDPFERDLVSTTVERSLIWSEPEQALNTVPVNEREILAAGVVYNQRIQGSVASAMARIKANLIDRLESRPFHTDCTLLRDVKAIQLPSGDPQFSGQSELYSSRNASDQLGNAVLRYVRQCVCDAFLPPCAPCEDPAVLLACLCIEGCEVASICNLERTFVLTPVAARYWMPFLRTFGDLLERVCCPADRCADEEESDVVVDPASDRRAVALERAYVERRSALDLIRRFATPDTMDVIGRFSTRLPEPLAFSADSARRVAVTAAAVIDVASLRRGIPVRDLVAPASFAIGGTATRPLGRPSATAAPPAPSPDPALEDIRAKVGDLTATLTAAEKRNRELERRIKKLEGRR